MATSRPYQSPAAGSTGLPGQATFNNRRPSASNGVPIRPTGIARRTMSSVGQTSVRKRPTDARPRGNSPPEKRPRSFQDDRPFEREPDRSRDGNQHHVNQPERRGSYVDNRTQSPHSAAPNDRGSGSGGSTPQQAAPLAPSMFPGGGKQAPVIGMNGTPVSLEVQAVPTAQSLQRDSGSPARYEAAPSGIISSMRAMQAKKKAVIARELQFNSMKAAEASNSTSVTTSTAFAKNTAAQFKALSFRLDNLQSERKAMLDRMKELESQAPSVDGQQLKSLSAKLTTAEQKLQSQGTLIDTMQKRLEEQRSKDQSRAIGPTKEEIEKLVNEHVEKRKKENDELMTKRIKELEEKRQRDLNDLVNKRLKELEEAHRRTLDNLVTKRLKEREKEIDDLIAKRVQERERKIDELIGERMKKCEENIDALLNGRIDERLKPFKSFIQTHNLGVASKITDLESFQNSVNRLNLKTSLDKMRLESEKLREDIKTRVKCDSIDGIKMTIGSMPEGMAQTGETLCELITHAKARVENMSETFAMLEKKVDKGIFDLSTAGWRESRDVDNQILSSLKASVEDVKQQLVNLKSQGHGGSHESLRNEFKELKDTFDALLKAGLLTDVDEIRQKFTEWQPTVEAMRNDVPKFIGDFAGSVRTDVTQCQQNLQDQESRMLEWRNKVDRTMKQQAIALSALEALSLQPSVAAVSATDVVELRQQRDAQQTTIQNLNGLLDITQQAVRSLEERYSNISTDGIYQQMVHYFTRTYEPSLILGRVDEMQQTIQRHDSILHQHVTWFSLNRQPLHDLAKAADKVIGFLKHDVALQNLPQTVTQADTAYATLQAVSKTIEDLQSTSTTWQTEFKQDHEASRTKMQQQLDGQENALTEVQTKLKQLSGQVPELTQSKKDMEKRLTKLSNNLGEHPGDLQNDTLMLYLCLRELQDSFKVLSRYLPGGGIEFSWIYNLREEESDSREISDVSEEVQHI